MKYLIVSAFLMSSTLAAAGEKIDKSLPVDRDGDVKISIVRGEVDIEAWDKAEVRVSGELDDRTERFIFETDGKETLIKVEIDDGGWGRNWDSDDTRLTISMPKDSSLDFDGVSADYNVKGILGGVEASTVSGDLDFADIAKSVDAQSVSGDIVVRDSWGKMRLASVSGDIETNGKAELFDAQSVSGDIDAVIGLAKIIDLTSVSGDLDVDFELDDDGNIDAETVSGDITLEFGNSKINARFDLNTGPGGDIVNGISNDEPETSFINAHELSFKMGDGSGSVEITTMSGSIELDN